MVFIASFFDPLEPEKISSLTTRTEDIDLIRVVDSIESMQKRYKKLLDRVTKDQEAVFEFSNVYFPKLRAQIVRRNKA